MSGFAASCEGGKMDIAQAKDHCLTRLTNFSRAGHSGGLGIGLATRHFIFLTSGFARRHDCRL
jgi:hypothetical protein